MDGPYQVGANEEDEEEDECRLHEQLQRKMMSLLWTSYNRI